MKKGDKNMKKNKIYAKIGLAALFALLTVLPLQAAETIHVETAGTLAELIGDSLTTIDDLTLTGNLNGADFVTLHQMTALKRLTMTDAKIVSGGTDELSTEENVFPNHLWADNNVSPLEYIAFPNEVTRIGEYTCYWLSTLKEVKLPDALLVLEDGAFESTDLRHITLPEGLQTIGHSVFQNCANLEAIHLPASVQSMGRILCLPDIVTVAEDNPYLKMQDGFLLSKDGTILYWAVSTILEGTLTIPDGVKEIQGELASGNVNPGAITAISLPASLEKISDGAFQSTNITTVALPAALKEIGERAFTYCPLDSITVTDGNTAFEVEDGNILYTAGKKELVFYSQTRTNEEYTFPAATRVIRDYVFNLNETLKQVNLPNNLKKIGDYAFAGTGLEEVVIPDGCVTIGTQILLDCNSLKKLVLPIKVTNLGTFCLTPNLTEIHCRSSEPYFVMAGYYIPTGFDFSVCKLYVPIGSLAAYQTADLWKEFTNIEEENVVVTLNDEATVTMQEAGTLATLLDGQTIGLTKLTISGPINGDDVDYFRNILTLEVLDLRKATIVDGGTYTALNVGDIPTKANTVTASMFHGDHEAEAGVDTWALREVYIPESVTAIEERAFAINPNLEVVHLGSASTFSGISILDTRSRLKAVYCLAEALPSISDGLGFYEDNQSEATLYVSYGLKADYEAATDWAGFKEVKQIAHVKTAGTLSTILGDNAATESELMLSGYLNGNDIITLRNMENLKFLDMRLANIVAGGDAYNENGDCTRDNIMDSFVFTDATAAQLDSLYLPNTLVELDDEVIQQSSLKKLVLNEGLQRIGSWVFFGCSSLQTLFIPASVTDMESAFWGGQTFDIEVSAENENYASLDGALYNKDMSRLISFPTGRTGNYTLPSTVEVIARECFYGCRLASLVVPEGVRELEAWALYNSQMATLSLPNTLKTIGFQAFAVLRNLRQVTIPESVTEVESDLFDGSGLAAIIWNSSASLKKAMSRYVGNIIGEGEMEDGDLSPYILLYVKPGAEVSDGWTNTIVDGVADNIVLSSNQYETISGIWPYPVFNAPKPFTANKISYTRTFNRDRDGNAYESGRGNAAGWQTLVLPFTPTEIIHEEKGTLAPFNSGVADTRPFWLRSLTADGYQSATTIEPNKPYIIAMPNHSTYDEQYNVVGDVTFTAYNVEIAATPESLEASDGAQYSLVPTYEVVEGARDSIYYLNAETMWVNNTEYPIGSIFRRSYYGIAPAFHAYVRSKEATATTRGPLYYSIGGGGAITGIEELPSLDDQSLRAYVNNGVLYLVSDRDRLISLYDVTGRQVRQVELRSGTTPVTGLAPGLYFLEGKKVLVK